MNELEKMYLDDLHSLRIKTELNTSDKNSSQKTILIVKTLKKRGEFKLEKNYPVYAGNYYVINGKLEMANSNCSAKDFKDIYSANLAERKMLHLTYNMEH